MAPVAVEESQLAPVDRALSPCADELHRLVGLIAAINKRNGDEYWAPTEAGDAVDSQNASLRSSLGSQLSPLAKDVGRRGFPIWKGELVNANASSNHRCIVVGMGACAYQIGDANLAHCSYVCLQVLIGRGIEDEAFHPPRFNQSRHVQHHPHRLLLLLVLLLQHARGAARAAPVGAAVVAAATAMCAAVAAAAACCCCGIRAEKSPSLLLL